MPQQPARRTAPTPPPPEEIDRVLRRALEEDLGAAGDVTSQALIGEDLRARAVVVAEEELVLAGVDMALRAFQLLDPAAVRLQGSEDGEWVKAGARVLEVEGLARGLLSAERITLNLMGRLCGVATTTRRAVDRVSGTPSRIFDTRKTTPGLRHLEKYAVRCGGGCNHRLGLHDMALIKENHIALVGSIAEAVRRARSALPDGIQVEIEVPDLAGFQEAMDAGADLVLLDHADIATVREAVRRSEGRLELEASGGITPESAQILARETGVHRISLGALTRSAVWSDLSMDVEILEGA